MVGDLGRFAELLPDPTTASPVRLRPSIVSVTGGPESDRSRLVGLVSEAEGVVPVGPLATLWSRGVLGDGPCGCGRSFSACAYWDEVGRRAFGGWTVEQAQHVAEMLSALVQPRYAPWLVARRPWPMRPQEGELLVATLDRLHRTISEVSGRLVVLDSSGSPLYALVLAQIRHADVRIVHLAHRTLARAATAGARVDRLRSVLVVDATDATDGGAGTFRRISEFAALPARSVRESSDRAPWRHVLEMST